VRTRSATLKLMLLWTLLIGLLPACLCLAQVSGGPGRPEGSPTRGGAGVLIGWQDLKGRWTFSIFEWPFGRAPTLEDVRRYPVLRGREQLKRKISSLPEGYILTWQDQRMLDPDSVKPVDRPLLTVPPQAVRAEVKRFAEAHHVVLVGPYPTSSVPHN